MPNSEAKIKVTLYLTRDELDGSIKDLMHRLDAAWNNRAKHEALVEALVLKRKRDSHYGANKQIWDKLTNEEIARDASHYGRNTGKQNALKTGKAVYPDRVPPKA